MFNKLRVKLIHWLGKKERKRLYGLSRKEITRKELIGYWDMAVIECLDISVSDDMLHIILATIAMLEAENK